MIYCQQKYKKIRGKATVFATITDKNKQKKQDSLTTVNNRQLPFPRLYLCIVKREKAPRRPSADSPSGPPADERQRQSSEIAHEKHRFTNAKPMLFMC